MPKLPLIGYTLLWIVILGGLVYSQTHMAKPSQSEEWMAVRICGPDNEEFNLYANRVFLIRKGAIQALSSISGDGDMFGANKPGCTQILMIGNRSIHVWGTMHRLMDRVDPDHNIDEEKWK